MTDSTFLTLAPSERATVMQALRLLSRSTGARPHRVHALIRKIEAASDYPTITVGVSGGQVQWTRGNPFPVRIRDYDGEQPNDLPDCDELGQRCRTWMEPPNING